MLSRARFQFDKLLSIYFTLLILQIMKVKTTKTYETLI